MKGSTHAPEWASWIGSALGGLMLAFAPLFWFEATIAEVYSLNSLIVAGLIFTLVSWYRTWIARWLYASWFLFGLGLANHVTVILMLPALLLASVSRQPSSGWRLTTAARLPALTIAGLAIYAYLPIRSLADPPRDWGNPETISGFLWLVSAQEFHHLVGSVDSAGLAKKTVSGFQLLLAQFGAHGLTLALVGICAAFRRDKALASGLILSGIGFAAHAVTYKMPEGMDWSMYFLPAHVILAFFIGLAATAVLVFLSIRSIRGTCAMGAAFLLAAVSSLMLHYRECDRHQFDMARRFAYTLSAHLPPNSVFLAENSVAHFALVYLQEVEGQRKDVVNVYLSLVEYPWYVDQLRRRYGDLKVPAWSPEILSDLISLNHKNRAFFTDWAAQGSLFPAEALTPSGMLFRVRTDGATVPRGTLESPDSRKLRSQADPPARERIDSFTLEYFMERHLVLAAYYDRQGLRGDAVQECERALQLAASHPETQPSPKFAADAHIYLATVARQRKDAYQTLKHLEQAVLLMPSDVALRDNLAGMYARAGLMRKAIKQWEEALRADPEDEQIRQRLLRAKRTLSRPDR